MKAYRMVLGALGLLCVAWPTAWAGVNELTPEEQQAGWRLLFNGVDHAGWKCSSGKPIATPVEDAALLPHGAGSYLILYDEPFGDFVLKCDVKWDQPRCNSGIFFRVEDPRDPVNTGFEVQVASGNRPSKHSFGAVYDLVAASTSAGKPAGEWNAVEIRCQGPEILVKVNDKEVARMNCDEFDQPGLCPDGQKHKYERGGQPRAIKEFARRGHLGFQDHGDKVMYRNVKLLELK